jgi:tRNA U34 5-methylaminomethyl-2-thiouridine-forming methyltransferase MnmC
MNDLPNRFIWILFAQLLRIFQSERQIKNFGINFTVRMPQIVTTEDGSHSIYVQAFDEHYHSVHGALTESQHVFIEAGFKQLKKSQIRILEMGFGTGLNAFLTFIEANKSDIAIHYTGIEKYPLERIITDSLNYESIIDPDWKGILNLIHDSQWQKEVLIKPGFILKKIQCDMHEMAEVDEFDLVYFDAFAPEKQPELWTEDLFNHIFQSMRSNSILTTYSSKGTVRCNLEAAGFRVEKIPGPPGKREMTRAYKS